MFGAPRCRVLVSKVEAGGATFEGNATLSNVALHACGGPGEAAYALDVGAPQVDAGGCGGCPPPAVPPAGHAALAGVVVVASGSGAVRAASAVAFSAAGCATVVSIGTGVTVESPGTPPRIADTLVMAARSDGSQDPPATQATACFTVCGVNGAPCEGVVTGCVCAGSADAGFVLYATPCGAASPYAGNVAHHALVGTIVHGRFGVKCAEVAGFAAYACSEVAIPSLYGQPGTYFASDVRLHHMVAATMDGSVAAAGGLQCTPAMGACSYTLSQSVVVGAPGGVGFMWNAFQETSPRYPRSSPPQSYFSMDADAAWAGSMHLVNVSFVDGATIVGGSNPDSSAPLSVAGLRFAGGAGRYFGRDPDPSWRDDSNCGNNTDCTGPRETLLNDLDGSLTGSVAQVLGNDAGLLGGDGRCAYRGDWNAYVCRGTAFRMLYMESLDPDRISRRLWPVRFTQRAGTSTVAGFMDHLWNGGWTSLLRLSRFAVPVEAAVAVTFTGTLPRNLRMETPAGVGGTVVEISYIRPELPQLTVGGAVMPRVGVAPTPSSAHGAWFWDGHRNAAMVTLQPGQPSVVATLTDLVMISLNLIVTDAAFWTAPMDTFVAYIASALSAAPADVVVVNVQPPVGRRRLRAAAGSMDLAWLAPGASNATLEAMQHTALAFFNTHPVMPGGVAVLSVARSYTSAPLCYVTFTMENGSVAQNMGSTCVETPPPPPPSPSPMPPSPPAPPSSPEGDAFPVAGVVSAVVIGVAAVGAGIAYGVWRSEQQPRTYPWLRRKVLRLKI